MVVGGGVVPVVDDPKCLCTIVEPNPTVGSALLIFCAVDRGSKELHVIHITQLSLNR